MQKSPGTASPSRKALRLRAAVLVGSCALLLGVLAASCGGSSSETPPPLEPLPANVHYDHAATTLPGELGTPTRAPAPVASSPAPAPTPFHPLGQPPH